MGTNDPDEALLPDFITLTVGDPRCLLPSVAAFLARYPHYAPADTPIDYHDIFTSHDHHNRFLDYMVRQGGWTAERVAMFKAFLGMFWDVRADASRRRGITLN